MKKKTILFDLDGTLLPMDQDAFTRGYFKLLAQKLAPHGYDPAALVDNIWAGTAAMVGNDGKRTNEAAFWDRFVALYGEQVREDIPLFDAFYRQEFQQAKAFCGFTPKARAAVEACKAAGHRVALATNPIFPAVATESRIRWAGLAPETFAWYTTYENIGYCKPNPDYYREILRYLDCRAEDCLMVGNDVEEDMMAAQAAGDLTGEGIGLGFQRATHSAARGYHHHIHGRALGHRKSHLANGSASRYGQRTPCLQKASQASAGNAAHLAQHMRVCFGISGGHTHLVYSQLLGQRRLQPGQSLQIPAEAPGHGQHALRRRSQAHSRRIQRNQAMLFQQRRHRAYLALRQVEPGGQLPSAHGLQRADAFQYQRTQFDFLRQIRSQLLHQGKITVLHCILPIRDKSRPA